MAKSVGSSSKVWKRFRDWIKVRAVIFVAVVLALPVYFTWRAATALPPGMAWDRDGIAVDLKTMTDWQMEPLLATDEAIPKWIRELDGKRVVLIGEVAPGIDRNRNQFDLVYHFPPSRWMPVIQYFVKCDYDDARKEQVHLQQGLIRAVGTLDVGIERDREDPNQITSVYRLRVESANPS